MGIEDTLGEFTMVKKDKKIKEEPLEKQLWRSADKLRKNIDACIKTTSQTRSNSS